VNSSQSNRTSEGWTVKTSGVVMFREAIISSAA
jgi:hypothetical protein